jgi:predicted RNase H-like nuclease (RuvC/YqgF family)
MSPLIDLFLENTFMKKIVIIAIGVSFLFASCKHPKKDIQSSSPEIPESLQEKSGNEISFSKSRKGEDLVESLYAGILEKNPSLSELEKTIEDLGEQKQDSVETFEEFDQKNKSYYTSTERYTDIIKDSLLRIKIKTIIDNSLNSYDRSIAANKNLISILNAKDNNLRDLHIILKLVKTLPLIEKYQAENTPSVKPVENVINHFDKAIQRADTLVWK